MKLMQVGKSQVFYEAIDNWDLKATQSVKYHQRQIGDKVPKLNIFRVLNSFITCKRFVT